MIFPILTDKTLEGTVNLRQGVLQKDDDKKSIENILFGSTYETFFSLGNIDKNLFPQASDKVPVRVTIKMDPLYSAL